MKRKRIASALLAMAMVLSLVTVPAFAEEPEAGKWYDEAMTTWADYGIIQGDANGDLLPEAQITRGELAVILDRLMDYQVTGKNTFTDVVVGEWYASAILAANAAGIVKGDGTTARPLDKITREEAAVMFARVLSLSGEGGASAGYTDEAQISSWAVDAVKSMTAKGYMKGSDGALRPKDPITRAEVMTILSNVFQAYYHEAGTYTEDVAGTAVVSVGGVTLKNMKVSGDLILAEGVADGTINLDGVTVAGKLIVRGGGEHSIIIKGRSVIGEVIVARQDGKVRVSVQGNAKVDVVVIDDGSDAVKVEGAVETLTIEGPGSKVEITGDVKNVTMSENAAGATLDVGKDAKVTTLTAAAEGAAVAVAGTVTNVNVSEGAKDATLDVAKTAKVQNLTTAAEGAKVAVAGTVTNVTVAEGAKDTTLEVAKGAAVSKVETAGDGTAITGNGAVKNVTVTGGEGTKIETPGTKVENKSESPVIVGDKEIASGETGKAEGTVPSTGGGGSSSGGSSTTYADVVTAPLHDTRTGEGKFVPDDKLTNTYTVTGGAESTSEGVTTASVTINATHVMRHQNAEGTLGYWVGFGMPKVDGNEYYYATTAEADGTKVDSVAKREYTVNGKTYNTVYFTEDTAEEYTDCYIKVKNGGVVTYIYHVTFNVTLAPDLENMTVAIATMDNYATVVPQAYRDKWPTADENSGLPWLVVTYTKNTTDTMTLTYTKDGATGSFTNDLDKNGGNSDVFPADKNKIGNGYVMYELAKDLNIAVGNQDGTYAVTLTVNGKGETKNVTYNPDGVATYTVTFNANSGTPTPASVTTLTGKTIAKPADPTRTGYTFEGWHVGSADGAAWTFDSDTVTGDTILYAKWTAKTFTVTYNYNGADGGTDTVTGTVTYDDTYATLPTPTKTGYTFDGWYTANEGGTKVENTTKVTATANHTLYARWTPVKYTVTFNSNEGSAVAPVQVPYDTLVTKPADPTKTGYTFVEWCKDEGLTAAWNFGTDKVTVDTTLYAKWRSVADITVMTGDTLTVGYVNNPATWGGVPATIDAFGTGITLTKGEDNNVYTATGTLNYITGFTGFGSDGCFLPIQFEVPADAAKDVTIITRGEESGEKTFASTDEVNGKHIYSVILIANAKRMAEGAKYPITVDWDGPDGKAEATDYYINFTSLTLPKVPTVSEILTKALDYNYDPVYTYNRDAIEITDEGLTYTATQAQVEDGTVVKDMARLLGALRRMDNGATIQKISYAGAVYTWDENWNDPAQPLKGSNWVTGNDAKTTLVSEVVKAYTGAPEDSIEITLNDNLTVTLTIKVSASSEN